MRRIYCSIFFSITLLILSVNLAYAGSSYVLPYPSTMPGGISYKLHTIFELLQKYWYYGDFGQFDYNLKESDKYLVEAKTLFEYDQYLLGERAIKKSNEYFTNITPSLEQARKNGKNIQEKKNIYDQAAQKHIETLQKMKAELPKTVTWNPEKGIPTIIPLEQLLNDSIGVRASKI